THRIDFGRKRFDALSDLCRELLLKPSDRGDLRKFAKVLDEGSRNLLCKRTLRDHNQCCGNNQVAQVGLHLFSFFVSFHQAYEAKSATQKKSSAGRGRFNRTSRCARSARPLWEIARRPPDRVLE